MARLPDTLAAGPIELRRWRTEDAPALFDAVCASLDELRPWMPWAGTQTTAESYVEVIGTFAAAFDEGSEFGFGMFELSGAAVVGACGLHFRNGPGVAEIGYWVRTDRVRRGYALAAASALTTAAFWHLPEIAEIHITMDKANVASTGVARRLGYTLAAEEDRDVSAPGHSGRGLRWVMTRAGWRSG